MTEGLETVSVVVKVTDIEVGRVVVIVVTSVDVAVTLNVVVTAVSMFSVAV